MIIIYLKFVSKTGYLILLPIILPLGSQRK